MTPEFLAQTQVERCEGIPSTPCNTLHNTSDTRLSPMHPRTGGIDALALRVQCTDRFTPSFHRMRGEIGKRKGFKKSINYGSEIDLRPYGISLILHEGLRGKPYGEHKLELKDVGKMSAADMRREITEVFDTDPDSLAVMRVDLYADTEVPLDWYQNHAYVKRKRRVRTYGKADVETEVRNCIKTVMLGSGSDLFRIYDKTALWQQEYTKAGAGVEIPSFVRTYGHAEGEVVTRVEHQLRGRSVPAQFRTVRSLFENAADFNPFQALALLSGGKREPDLNAYALNDCLCGMGARSYIEKHGLAEFRAFVNRQSKNNAGKVFRRIRDFIPTDEEFIAPDLTALYQRGVREQLLGLTSYSETISTTI